MQSRFVVLLTAECKKAASTAASLSLHLQVMVKHAALPGSWWKTQQPQQLLNSGLVVVHHMMT